ncbi:hypothetical protein ACGFYP_12260 [Streptomyces sp. NPDC048370]|uniref:hypothetical protein n=1 Tax=Streptomyces sp. NPDC048370 TaxID=3365540 RepID=UPI00371FBC3E
MSKHRAPSASRHRVPSVSGYRAGSVSRHRARSAHAGVPATDRARRQLAAGLLTVGALAATFLTVAVDPAAPPAPDRAPVGTTSDVAQLSRD